MGRLAVVVPVAEAERTLRALHRAGVLDGARKTERRGDEVWLPVTRRIDGHRVVEADLRPRADHRAPRDEIVDELRDALPPEALPFVPDKWEKLGDVVVLRLSDELRPWETLVAAAFANGLGARTVLEDRSGVAGELREMRATVLWGDDTVATHVENGIRYRFDAARVMFSSGNVHERMRAAALPARGETVVDMFAGIGYFTLPLAVHAGAARVHALEKNPVSFQYLVENVALNGVEAVVAPWHGDNRDFPHEGIADRVMMGYFPGTRAFLPKAFAFLKPGGGTIHYHDTAHERTCRDELTRNVLEEGRACGRVVAIRDARVVKSHSPGVVHAALVISVRGAACGSVCPWRRSPRC